jgi:hypothetical protein
MSYEALIEIGSRIEVLIMSRARALHLQEAFLRRLGLCVAGGRRTSDTLKGSPKATASLPGRLNLDHREVIL